MIKFTVLCLFILAFLLLVCGSFWAAGYIAIWDSLRLLWQDPWFKMTLLDLYIGFGIFLGYVMYREKSVIKSVFCFILIIGLGNIVSLFYLVTELYSAKKISNLLEAKRDQWQLF